MAEKTRSERILECIENKDLEGLKEIKAEMAVINGLINGVENLYRLRLGLMTTLLLSSKIIDTNKGYNYLALY